MNRTRIAIIFLFVVMTGTHHVALAQGRGGGASSPEILPDGRVTFRLRAPAATEVIVSFGSGSGASFAPISMAKSADGLWSATTPAPVPPNLYPYSFIVDGARVPDPANLTNTWASSPSGSQAGTSALMIPGTPWTNIDGPHGAVAKHVYKSPIIGGLETYYVYTPPGYDFRRKTPYPVFVGLHGLGNDAQDWIVQVGANLTLDTLISEGKAEPMILVSPAAYGTGKNGNAAAGFPNFTKALLDEILPQVEREYNASNKASDRAISGTSMGGAQSLLMLNHTDKFAWIGSFSPGLDMYDPNWGGGGGANGGGGRGAAGASGAAAGRGGAGNAGGGRGGANGGRGSVADIVRQRPVLAPGNLDNIFPGLSPKTTANLRLLYLACGTADDHLDLTKQFRDFVESKGIRVNKFVEGKDEAHTFSFWRKQFAEFAPLLFKPAAK